jgi:hypothetical protein
MKSTKFKMLFVASLLALMTSCAHEQSVKQQVWKIDSLDNINGFAVEALGDPQVIDTVYGEAVMFDGNGDRLLVGNNPLEDATEFTIEIIFKPADVFPDNWEPRFFHIEAPNNPDRRVTIELRLNDKKQWYLDTYIKSELSQSTLIDATLVHPVEQWAHAAITYKDRQFTAYVNGKKELASEVDYLPISANGLTSIGARMNQVHWLNGAILAARITHKKLTPDQFLQLEDFAKN